jgi:catechol 2,3-dioxygenase-like lactoylglutathione lyase family enzyme
VRRPRAALLLAAFALAGVPAPREGAAASPAVETAGFTVSDLERAERFFREVLDFEAEARFSPRDAAALEQVPGGRARVARLRLGAERIELVEYRAPAGRPVPPDLRSNDLAFQHVAIVVADMDRAYARLRAHDVQHVSAGPQTLPESIPAAAGIRAFYFRDPDGHNLELIGYPPGKGDPRWQERPPGRLFLGIDHTAIAVDDTARSLAFYRDALGLRVAGESENAGLEQERLNGVFASRVRITGLRAAAGPGIEFLDYLAPAGGRPIPADLRANDLLSWRTTLALDDAAARCRALGAEAVVVDRAVWGFAQGCLVRDPDGHALRLVER